MFAIGRREIVGLLLFGVALAVTVSFYLPGFGKEEPHGLRVSDLGTSATVVGTNAGLAFADPGGWEFAYRADDGSGGRAETKATRLNLAFDAEPAPGLPQDQWILTAETTFPLQAGNYHFVIEYRGSVVVRVNGSSAVTGESQRGELAALVVPFQHVRGKATIQITARDSEGPFVVRWKR